MAKTYFNDAIVGNSCMLGCISENGELVRLFWPNIDFPQHIDKMLTGVFLTGYKNSTVWLNESEFNKHQQYIEDTNIVKTVFEDIWRGLKIEQLDFVLPDKDIFVRHYNLENTGEQAIEPGFIIFSSGMSNGFDRAGIFFDFENEALVHYRHGYYISLSADREVYQFQLGNNAFESAKSTWLNGFDNIGMMSDGAVSWKLDPIYKGEKKTFTLYICASHSLKGIKAITKCARNGEPSTYYEATRNYWINYLKGTKKVLTGVDEIDSLYKRSLLVFKLMADKKSGGLLASPEVDEEFTRCGKYAYCWGRDAAFITAALDKCGLGSVVDKFYDWVLNTQDENGSWHQRYYMDGNLAPSWGLQIDETGTLVWGMLKHYEVTKDIAFLEKMWESAKRAVEFMIKFIDEETGLPGPSYDLWEERFGEHAYSSAAVYAGIKAGARIAEILGFSRYYIDDWKSAAEKIKTAIVKNFWKEEEKRFIRSVRVKLNPWEEEHTDNKIMIKVNPKGYCKDVTSEDWTVDVSLLGMAIPFEVFDVEDPRIVNTVKTIEERLISPKVGGLKRYENDKYIGGNPWIITTLWAALYHIKKGDFSKAKDYFEWAVKSCTKLNLLPEQVDKESGKPAWVIPLTWSHAMFILVLTELTEKGVL
ncbi:MAG TPA: glycoside hydrolase [Clostridiaceae bacterium]|nr:glycoside hydrolase [Clostridiaceae bacterium]